MRHRSCGWRSQRCYQLGVQVLLMLGCPACNLLSHPPGCTAQRVAQGSTFWLAVDLDFGAQLLLGRYRLSSLYGHSGSATSISLVCDMLWQGGPTPGSESKGEGSICCVNTTILVQDTPSRAMLIMIFQQEWLTTRFILPKVLFEAPKYRTDMNLVFEIWIQNWASATMGASSTINCK